MLAIPPEWVPQLALQLDSKVAVVTLRRSIRVALDYLKREIPFRGSYKQVILEGVFESKLVKLERQGWFFEDILSLDHFVMK